MSSSGREGIESDAEVGEVFDYHTCYSYIARTRAAKKDGRKMNIRIRDSTFHKRPFNVEELSE